MKADLIPPLYAPARREAILDEQDRLDSEGLTGAERIAAPGNRRYLAALRRAAGTDVLVILADNTLARLTVDPAEVCEGIPG